MGSYSEANDVLHGFLRGPNGAFTVFDPPGSIDTGAAAVNQDGAITGFFGSSIVNGSLIAHGFLRTRNGTFTTFDPTGSASTAPTAINPGKTIAGLYSDANGVLHGFLRPPSGAVTTLDLPGTLSPFFPSVAGISPAGAIAGFYIDASWLPACPRWRYHHVRSAGLRANPGLRHQPGGGNRWKLPFFF